MVQACLCIYLYMYTYPMRCRHSHQMYLADTFQPSTIDRQTDRYKHTCDGMYVCIYIPYALLTQSPNVHGIHVSALEDRQTHRQIDIDIQIMIWVCIFIYRYTHTHTHRHTHTHTHIHTHEHTYTRTHLPYPLSTQSPNVSSRHVSTLTNRQTDR